MDTNTEEVKKIFKWVWIVLIVLAIFLAVETLEAFKNLRSIDLAYNSISVSGVGEAVSVPDIAVFSFTVSADAKVAGDAQGQVTRKMDVILAGLKTLGVEERDINTTDYSLWPKYTFGPTICSPTFCPPSRQVQDGYTASHNVSVKVRSTEDVGEALALAGENGATGLSSISFTVDDPDKILDEARAEAITDAREKAKLLSKELGVRLVRVVSFYDNTGGEVLPYYTEGLEGDAVKASSPAPTIPIGENKVNVNVTIVYEIR
ncbi:MAG: SIMPL domain-containing protein [bacterium]|nr:SIMPL domain-containing protein [bacterium]